jgi:signal transduction histidine kinase
MVSTTLISSLLRIGVESDSQSQIRESPAPTKKLFRVLGSASLVGLGYYFGTRVGFALTPSGQPNSTFWPPNAILLAAFLLAPRRVWWTFLLAVLPAHLLAQMQVGVPTSTAVGWFISNTSEALFGALCITHFANQKSLFDSVRGVFVFVGFGVVLAPLATSFLDAAAVIITHWGRGYLPITTERFWTNALAELTIVPAIMTFGTIGRLWIQKVPWVRFCEAALLGLSTVLVSLVVFGTHVVSPASTPALLYVPLPLLLWATLRFRSGGLSLCFISLVLIAIWFTLHGHEPFPYASLPQNVLSLQILFCIVVVPLMFLSAIMAEAQRSHQSLRELSAQLITAQEQERTRIGRELHDDISQRLALLGVELQQLQDNPSELPRHVKALREELGEISNDVQGLSHELHSSKLEYLGVGAGIKSWCKEFSERQQLEVAFTNEVSGVLPLEIGVCLFRVLQEALHNAVKHSGARKVAVQLREDFGEIHLVINDSGRGFDVIAASHGKGLGLTSMRERVRLVNGTIAIDSEPMRGTTIHVRVPLESEKLSKRAVG